MGNLISGKEALIAIANGECVQWSPGNEHWINASHGNSIDLYLDKENECKFRLKPHTITINGIEVPAPFEPKDGERFWYFSDEYTTGYASGENPTFFSDISLGAWRTEDEIKQVVAALRTVFKGATQ